MAVQRLLYCCWKLEPIQTLETSGDALVCIGLQRVG